MQATYKSIVQISFVILMLSFTSTSMAKIYKWTDANGKTHYTATPPPSKEKSEEFKVQKIKKSSLTNIDKTIVKIPSDSESLSKEKDFTKVDPTLSAQSQCKKASKKRPAMFAAIKSKIDESKASGKMSESQYNKALKQMKVSQAKQPNFAECVRKYNSGDQVEINQLANNDSQSALSYLMLKAQQDKKELEKQLKFK